MQNHLSVSSEIQWSTRKRGKNSGWGRFRSHFRFTLHHLCSRLRSSSSLLFTVVLGVGGVKTLPFLHPHGCCRDNRRFTLKNKKPDRTETAQTSCVSECRAQHVPVIGGCQAWDFRNGVPLEPLEEICVEGLLEKMLALHSTSITLDTPTCLWNYFHDSRDLLVRKVNVGNFQWPQGIIKCNFCEFRLTMGGNPKLCWLFPGHVVRDWKLQPALYSADESAHVFGSSCVTAVCEMHLQGIECAGPLEAHIT